jgi:hypothetical protein
VLFADASRISLRALHREFEVPLRLLGVGLPLTIVAHDRVSSWERACAARSRTLVSTRGAGAYELDVADSDGSR